MEKYTLNYTRDGHILSISHTAADDVELDLSTIDTDHLGAYRYIDGALALDEDKLAEMLATEKRAENAVEVSRLKAEIAATDYQIIKCSECALLGEPMPYDVAKLHERRQAIRDAINALKSKGAGTC